MLVDCYSSMPHYAEHIQNVWAALPAAVRGTWWRPRAADPWGDRQLAVDRDVARLVLVAGYADAQRMAPAPLVYLEHGAGQTYGGDPRAATDPSYSGGTGHERVRLFLCPSVTVADRWRARYPATPAAVVGCPKLDAHHAAMAWAERPLGLPTVAVTFHWEANLVPETRSAWSHYDSALPALARHPAWRLLGHGHPRLWGTISRRWRQLGVACTPNLDDVLDQADLLVADNTSALFEVASIGKPVVVVNAPWYRRHVHHGLRFWDYPPGLQVDHPHQLAATILRALADPPEARAIRHAAVAEVYAFTDGHAADRAAAAIVEVLADEP